MLFTRFARKAHCSRGNVWETVTHKKRIGVSTRRLCMDRDRARFRNQPTMIRAPLLKDPKRFVTAASVSHLPKIGLKSSGGDLGQLIPPLFNNAPFRCVWKGERGYSE